jgi:hypothetical protein
VRLAEYINFITDFCRANPFIAAACGIFLIYLFCRKPKFFLSVLVLALVLAVMMHFILNAASSGLSLKQELIDNTGIHKGDLIRSQNFLSCPRALYLHTG